jgi:hypothetical protein
VSFEEKRTLRQKTTGRRQHHLPSCLAPPQARPTGVHCELLECANDPSSSQVQIAAFMGWFPYLFYSTTYVADVMAKELGHEPDTDKATRAGSLALLIYSFGEGHSLSLTHAGTYRSCYYRGNALTIPECSRSSLVETGTRG